MLQEPDPSVQGGVVSEPLLKQNGFQNHPISLEATMEANGLAFGLKGGSETTPPCLQNRVSKKVILASKSRPCVISPRDDMLGNGQ